MGAEVPTLPTDLYYLLSSHRNPSQAISGPPRGIIRTSWTITGGQDKTASEDQPTTEANHLFCRQCSRAPLLFIRLWAGQPARNLPPAPVSRENFHATRRKRNNKLEPGNPPKKNTQNKRRRTSLPPNSTFRLGRSGESKTPFFKAAFCKATFQVRSGLSVCGFPLLPMHACNGASSSPAFRPSSPPPYVPFSVVFLSFLPPLVPRARASMVHTI